MSVFHSSHAKGSTRAWYELSLQTGHILERSSLTQTKMKIVTFAESSPQVFSSDTLTKEEVGAVWYSRTELNGISTQCRLIVAGRLKDESTRGLEMVINPSALSNHREAVREILCEQQKQRQAGAADPASLASVAQKVAAHRQRLAQVRGKLDALAVRGDIWKALRTASVSEDNRAARRAQRTERTRVLPRTFSAGRTALA